MTLKGKVALITGSTSGIGWSYAQAIAKAGASVVLNGFGDPLVIEQQRLQLESMSQASAIYHPADLTRVPEIETMVRGVLETLGNIDILINNAGVQHVAPVEEFPSEKWDEIIALHLTAAFHTTRLVISAMKKNRWGRIIQTASAHSVTASPYKSAYVAAKHGLVGFTKSVALEVAQHGITANCISPGYVWTSLVENQIPDTMQARGLSREQVINDVLLARQPTKQFVTAEQVAEVAIFLCSDAASNITGANLSVDGGWTAGAL